MRKIISFVVLVTFLFTNTVYSSPATFTNNNTLRPNLMTDNGKEAGRLKNLAKAVAEEELKNSREAASYMNQLIDKGTSVPETLKTRITALYLKEQESIAAVNITSVLHSNSKYTKRGVPEGYPGITVVSNLEDNDHFTKIMKSIIGDEYSNIKDNSLSSVKKWHFETLQQKDGRNRMYIATVPTDSVHVTLYDGMSKGEFKKGSKYYKQLNDDTRDEINDGLAGSSDMERIKEVTYQVVQKRIIEALQGFKVNKIPRFKPIGVAAFPPGGKGVGVLVVNVAPVNAEDLAAVTKLQDLIKDATGIENHGAFTGHVTIGYFVNPVEGENFEKFKEYITELDEYIKNNSDKLEFELPSIEVSKFPNMASYPPVKGGSFKWLGPNQTLTNLPFLETTPVLFLDTEVVAYSNDFGQALGQLKAGKGNIPVILLTKKTQQSIRAKLKNISLEGVRFRTLTDLGLQDFKLDEVMSLIVGIDDLRVIPLTDSLTDAYEALKKAEALEMEEALKQRYISYPQIAFKEKIAFDPLNPQHIKNAYDNVIKLEQSAIEVDRTSEAYRLEIAKKLKDLVKPSNEFKGYIDLHVHTFRSDGQYSPTYIVYEAWKKGLKTIGVVDHNTFRHFKEAVRAGDIFDIEVIPGVEFDVSGEFKVNGKDKTLEYVHMVGYFPYGKGIEQRENKEEFLKWVEELEGNKDSLYHQAEKRRLWNNIKQELIRQRFNRSKNRGDFKITLSDWLRYTTGMPNWAQIVAILVNKYGEDALSGKSKSKEPKDWKNHFVNGNEVKAGNLMISDTKGGVDSRVRGPVDFWKHRDLNNQFSGKLLNVGYPHLFGIDIGEFARQIEVLNGRVVLAHPVEDRNFWVEANKNKEYKNASPREKKEKLQSVFEQIFDKYPKFKDVLWGIEVYSAKHSEQEVIEFGKLANKIQGQLGKKSFVKTIGSDAHYNDYEGEGTLKMAIGKGDQWNLLRYQRQDLSNLKTTPVLFLDTDVFRNPASFNQALEQLRQNEGNIPVILLTEGRTEDDIRPELEEIDLTGVQFRILTDLGLQDFNLDEVMSLIAEIDDLRVIPLTDSLTDTYEALKKTRDQV